MTLDEAIKVLRQHNEKGTSVLRITRGQALEKDLLAQVLDSCEQLISEKAEYKRLLKSAVEGFNLLGNYLDDNCPINVNCIICPLHRDINCKCWKHQDEALALIGKDTNVPASADDINVGHKSGGWISCEDRLPEESGTYICAAKSAGRNIVTFVKWQPRYKQWNLTGARSYWQVTYWQPLPEPPKDGDT